MKARSEQHLLASSVVALLICCKASKLQWYTSHAHHYTPVTCSWPSHTRTLRDSQLALKHRRNKHGGQRLVVFVGSPVTAKDVVLKKLGNQLRKNNVTTTLRGVPTHTHARTHPHNTHPRPLAAVPSQIAIDVICMGENEHNQPKVTVLVDAANSNDNR